MGRYLRDVTVGCPFRLSVYIHICLCRLAQRYEAHLISKMLTVE
jgi:hypothetical protein